MSRNLDEAKHLGRNRSLVDEAIHDDLAQPLANYVCYTLSKAYKDQHRGMAVEEDGWWKWGVLDVLYADKKQNLPMGGTYGDLCDSLDVQCALTLVDLHWKGIFSKQLPRTFYNWIKEINSIRNDWAHFTQANLKEYTDDYLIRVYDTIARILDKIDPDGVEPVRAKIREIQYGSADGSLAAAQAMAKSEEAPETAKETPAPAPPAKPKGKAGFLQTAGKLPSWREVMQPHPDVRKGKYKNAEFAADLAQVARGEGSIEYVDPVEFFSRTYITEGMKGLLTTTLQRVAGIGGEPVLQLKTSFGGGKTHSMLSIYHLFHGKLPLHRLPQMEALLGEAGMQSIPDANVAVLVGTALDPTQWKRPIDLPGITIHTLWGEMAAQLAKGARDLSVYDIVKEADKKGVSPGSEKLRELFDRCGACVILIDELVAYARKLYGAEDKHLPAGTFANVLSFIQEITEAAKASKRSIVIASIPASEIEIGGAAGQEALAEIEHTFGRIESIWKPVTPQESFEVVRRRLFLPCTNPEARDTICHAFAQMYQESGNLFPVKAKDANYEQRLLDCYPIHPEIFDDLYEEWSTIQEFQRTRSVLRLMAGVVHQLWTNGDASPMILPGAMPLQIQQVHDELLRYLEHTWSPIVDSEIDGPNAESVRIDSTSARFANLMAARRVARTIFLATAPGTHQQRIRGIDETRIRLGVALPGEQLAVFDDAVQKLKGALSYLYSNDMGNLLWFDSRPTLRKLVADQEERIHADDIEAEIEDRLHRWKSVSGIAIRTLPKESADVPDDDRAVSLVILPLQAVHERGQSLSAATAEAAGILEARGSAGRIHKNMLTFLAPDKKKLIPLKKIVKRYLAWCIIRDEAEARGLAIDQLNEAKNSIAQVDRDVRMKLSQAYAWILSPYIETDDLRTVLWDVYEISCIDGDNIKAAKKRLIDEEALIERWGATLLKMKLDSLFFRERDSISVQELWNCFANYCYLPRLAERRVLEDTIREGVKNGAFAMAEMQDAQGNYHGLRVKRDIAFEILVPGMLVVKEDVAEAQVAAAEAKRKEEEQKREDDTSGAHGGCGGGKGTSGGGDWFGGDDTHGGQTGGTDTVRERKQKPRRFLMETPIDDTRVNKQVNDYVQEVLVHLQDLPHAKVSIRLEIEVDIPEGADDTTVRTVSENCRTLKTESYQFD
ncbi:DUF499 domain-containing protein [uncultured Selenomonas sp.]|uniref:DUF499 domain-containing protein n=1 Tax=uncultured Selenomonas sp. TaxID=159275 RepID=UPI0025EDCBA3|nr:DUF499 domain-containing protein [uncultured Selenomonas sp.]